MPNCHICGKADIAMLCVCGECREPSWIPVGERLPENNDNVLAYTPPVDNTAGSLEATRGFMVRLGKRTGITHWMPMPEPPKRGVKDEQYADI